MINYYFTIAATATASMYYLIKKQKSCSKPVVNDNLFLTIADSSKKLYHNHELIKDALKGVNKEIFKAIHSTNLMREGLIEKFGEEAYNNFCFGGYFVDLRKYYGYEKAFNLRPDLFLQLPRDLQEKFGIKNAGILYKAFMSGDFLDNEYLETLPNILTEIEVEWIPYKYHFILDTIAKSSVATSFVIETLTQFYPEKLNALVKNLLNIITSKISILDDIRNEDYAINYISKEQFLNAVKEKIDECTELYGERTSISKIIMPQLSSQFDKIENEIYTQEERDSLTSNECRADIEYFFDNPLSFDTGYCAELMMGSINEICFNN